MKAHRKGEALAAELRETLARRIAAGEAATVRTTSRAHNRAVFSAEILDGAQSEAVSASAVRWLVQAGHLVQVYQRGIHTDYELSASARRRALRATPNHQPVPTGREEPAMSTTTTKETVTMEEARERLRLTRGTLDRYVAPSTGPILKTEGRGKNRRVLVDEEFRRREAAAQEREEVEATIPDVNPVEACTEAGEPDEGETFDDGGEQLNRVSESKGLPPIQNDIEAEEHEAAEVVAEGYVEAAQPDVVPEVGHFPIPEEDDEELIAHVMLEEYSPAMGDGQTEEIDPISGDTDAIDDLIEEVQYASNDVSLEVLLDAVRNATLVFVNLSLFGLEDDLVEDARKNVAEAVRIAEDAMGTARHTLDEAERIAGLNELPAVRLSAPAHEEEA